MLLPDAASSSAIRGESESHIATAYHSQVSMPLVPSIPPPPPPVPTIPTWFQGSFRKVQVRPIKGFGLYRGGGTVEIHPPGLRILGQHVYSGGIRSLLFLGLFPFITLIGAYLIVEFALLKTEVVQIPWPSIRRYAADPKKGEVAIEFSGPGWTSPVVFRTPQWAELHQALRDSIPAADAGPGRQKSRPLLIVGAVLVSLIVIGMIWATVAAGPNG
jgi:hypothetical protein